MEAGSPAGDGVRLGQPEERRPDSTSRRCPSYVNRRPMLGSVDAMRGKTENRRRSVRRGANVEDLAVFHGLHVDVGGELRRPTLDDRGRVEQGPD